MEVQEIIAKIDKQIIRLNNCKKMVLKLSENTIVKTESEVTETKKVYKKRKGAWTEEQERTAYSLKKKGMKTGQIAKKIGKTMTQVSQHFYLNKKKKANSGTNIRAGQKKQGGFHSRGGRN